MASSAASLSGMSIDDLLESLKGSIPMDDREHLLQAIDFILPDNRHLDSALDLLDRSSSKIFKYTSESGPERPLWRIYGSRGVSYVCTKQFCPCKNFIEINKFASCTTLCKHLLAIRVATLLGVIEERTLPDQEYLRLYASEFTVFGDA